MSSEPGGDAELAVDVNANAEVQIQVDSSAPLTCQNADANANQDLTPAFEEHEHHEEPLVETETVQSATVTEDVTAASAPAMVVAATSAVPVPGWSWDDLQCPICLDPIMDTLVANCSHRFCTFCIQRWFRTRGQRVCPVCRSDVDSILASLDLDAAIARLALGHLNETQIREREAVRRVRRLDALFVGQEQRMRAAMQERVTGTGRPRAVPTRRFDPYSVVNGGWRTRGQRPASRQEPQPQTRPGTGSWSGISSQLSSAASTRPATPQLAVPDRPASVASSSSTPRLHQIEEIEHIAEEFEACLRRAQRANERRTAAERELNANMGRIGGLYERFAALGVLTSRDEVDVIRQPTPRPIPGIPLRRTDTLPDIHAQAQHTAPLLNYARDSRDDYGPVLLMYRELDDVFGEAIFTARQFQQQEHEPESEGDDRVFLNFLQQEQPQPQNFDYLDFGIGAAAPHDPRHHAWPVPSSTGVNPSPYDPSASAMAFTGLSTGNFIESIYHNNFGGHNYDHPQPQVEYEFDAERGVWSLNSYPGTGNGTGNENGNDNSDTDTTELFATTEDESTLLTPRPNYNYANRTPFRFNSSVNGTSTTSSGSGSGTQGSPSPQSRQLITEHQNLIDWRRLAESERERSRANSSAAYLREIIRERAEATERFSAASEPEVTSLTEQRERERERELGLPQFSRRRARRRSVALPNDDNNNGHSYNGRPEPRAQRLFQSWEPSGEVNSVSENLPTLRSFLAQFDAESRPETATTETEAERDSDQERTPTADIQQHLRRFFSAGENERNFQRLMTGVAGQEQDDYRDRQDHAHEDEEGDDNEVFEYHEFGATPELEEGEGEDENGNRNDGQNRDRDLEFGGDRFFDAGEDLPLPLFRGTSGSYHFHHHSNGYFTREADSTNSTACRPPPSAAREPQFEFEFADGSRLRTAYPYNHRVVTFTSSPAAQHQSQGQDQTPGSSRITTAPSENDHDHESDASSG